MLILSAVDVIYLAKDMNWSTNFFIFATTNFYNTTFITSIVITSININRINIIKFGLVCFSFMAHQLLKAI